MNILHTLGLATGRPKPASEKPGFRTIEVKGRVAYEASLPAPLADAPAPAGGMAYKEAAHLATLSSTISLINSGHRAAQANGEG